MVCGRYKRKLDERSQAPAASHRPGGLHPRAPQEGAPRASDVRLHGRDEICLSITATARVLPAERTVSSTKRARRSKPWDTSRFGRSSNEIEQGSLAKKASLPARTIWSRETGCDLKAVLREHRPDVVHVHNTFPLLSAAVLYACRDARVRVVATIHNYKLACANGTFFRRGAVCHDCAHGLPVPALLHGCYRGSYAATAPVALGMSLHRQAWRSLVSAYVFISASQPTCYGESTSRPTAYSSGTTSSPP